MKKVLVMVSLIVVLLVGCQKLPVQHIVYNIDSIEYKFDIDNSTGFYLANDSGRFVISNNEISIEGMFIDQDVYDYYKHITENKGGFENTNDLYKAYFFEHEDVYGLHYGCIITNYSNDVKLMLISKNSFSEINEVLSVIKFEEEGEGNK